MRKRVGVAVGALRSVLRSASRQALCGRRAVGVCGRLCGRFSVSVAVGAAVAARAEDVPFPDVEGEEEAAEERRGRRLSGTCCVRRR